MTPPSPADPDLLVDDFLVDAHSAVSHAEAMELPAELETVAGVADILRSAISEASEKYALWRRSGAVSDAATAAQGPIRQARGKADIAVALGRFTPEIDIAVAAERALHDEMTGARESVAAAVADGDLDKMLASRAQIDVTLPAKIDEARLQIAGLRVSAAETAQAAFTARKANIEEAIAQAQAALDEAPGALRESLHKTLTALQDRAAVLCSPESEGSIQESVKAAIAAREDVHASVHAGQRQRIARLSGVDPEPTLTSTQTTIVHPHVEHHDVPIANPRSVKPGTHMPRVRLVDPTNPYQPQVAEVM